MQPGPEAGPEWPLGCATALGQRGSPLVRPEAGHCPWRPQEAGGPQPAAQEQSALGVWSGQHGIPGGDSVCPHPEGHTGTSCSSPPTLRSCRAGPPVGDTQHCDSGRHFPGGGGDPALALPHPSQCLTRHHLSLCFFACGGGSDSHLRRQPWGRGVKAVVRRFTWPPGTSPATQGRDH